jgi:hypothetical protein
VMMTVLSHFEQHFVSILPLGRTVPFCIWRVESFSAVGR